jgi:formyl-CoA transferase
MSDLALTGIRVVEVSQAEVATACGQQLAWLGADVIKVERPEGGDGTRRLPAFFGTLNSSKRSVVIDLKTAGGREVFLDLVRTADVVIENLSPGKFEEFGLGYETLRSANPRVVFARAKAFGTWGEYGTYKGYDMMAQAASGAMAATGTADGPPLIERFPVADNATGMHLALGIMAALWQRERTGKGQEVEVALHDTMLSMGRMWFSQYFAPGGRPDAYQYMRNTNRCNVLGDLYPCAGSRFDQIYIIANERRPMWATLLRIVGRPDLATRPEKMSAEEYDDEVNAAVRAWTATRDKFDVMQTLGEAGVPAAAVLTSEEVLENPHVHSREMIVEVEHDTHGRMTILGCPIKMSSSPAHIASPPLELGEHTAAMLRELGYPDTKLAALRADGAIPEISGHRD